MKCPQCCGDFNLTWKLYIKAPFGRFPCPLCKTKLIGNHHWFYWPLMLLGCCLAGIPLAIWGEVEYGFAGFLSGLIIGILLGGIPFDRYLESKFSILKVNKNDSSTMPSEDDGK